MRIYKIAAPLPLDEIGIEPGGMSVNRGLSRQEAAYLSKRFKLVRSLGEGMWGIAYLTGDGKVLKITSDIQEVKIAKMLMNFAPYEPFAQVYETGEIGDNLYYVLKEKVRPLSEEEIVLFYDMVTNSSGYDFEEKFLSMHTPEDLIKLTKFNEYMNEVSNYGFNDVLSPYNIGYNDQGNLVCFDPSMI
jgi:hypothetical protein